VSPREIQTLADAIAEMLRRWRFLAELREQLRERRAASRRAKREAT